MSDYMEYFDFPAFQGVGDATLDFSWPPLIGEDPCFPALQDSADHNADLSQLGPPPTIGDDLDSSTLSPLGGLGLVEP